MATHWREKFLAGGQCALKSRPAGEHEAEIQRRWAKAGDSAMNDELLLEQCHRLEAAPRLPRWRPGE